MYKVKQAPITDSRQSIFYEHSQSRKIMKAVSLWLILLFSCSCHCSFAQTHKDSDRIYMSDAFDGVWFLSATEEIMLIRIEPTGLSVLADDSVYFRDAEVIDINRDERAITFIYEDKSFTLTRAANIIKFSTPDGKIHIGERSRRLTKHDNERLDVWYKFTPNPCGLFNQFCEEEENNNAQSSD